MLTKNDCKSSLAISVSHRSKLQKRSRTIHTKTSDIKELVKCLQGSYYWESSCVISVKRYVTGKETITEVKLTEILQKIKFSCAGVSYFTTAQDPWGKFI